jgi:hypothetical protein
MTTQEKIDVLTAYRDGKQIQTRERGIHDSEWSETASPTWDFSRAEYRVKPEPRRIWVNSYAKQYTSFYFNSKMKADALAGPGRTECIEFVEVIK